MPLIQSASKEALAKNIQTEIRAGKDPKQAAAIAYSVQRKNDALTGRRTLLNGPDYIDVDFDKNTVVTYHEDENGNVTYKRSLVPNVYSSAQEFWERTGKTMKKVDRFFWSKFYNDAQSINDTEKPEYLGTKIEFAEGNTLDEFHRTAVGKFFEKSRLSDLNRKLSSYNDFLKESNAPGYNKVYFDHIIRYGGKKYKIHLGRYDAGSEPRGDVFTSATIEDILEEFLQVFESDSSFKKSYYQLKSVDKCSLKDAKDIAQYVKVTNGKVEMGKLVLRNDNQYTFVSTEPKHDKDFYSRDEAEKYIRALNYVMHN